MQILEQFLRDFKGNPPLAAQDFERILRDIPFTLPEDYLAVMRLCNGGSGFVGANFLMLYDLGQLMDLHRASEIATHLPGIFVFGSEGGAEGFAFDFRKESASLYIMIPFVYAADAIIPQGNTFLELLHRLHDDQIFEHALR